MFPFGTLGALLAARPDTFKPKTGLSSVEILVPERDPLDDVDALLGVTRPSRRQPSFFATVPEPQTFATPSPTRARTPRTTTPKTLTRQANPLQDLDDVFGITGPLSKPADIPIGTILDLPDRLGPGRVERVDADGIHVRLQRGGQLRTFLPAEPEKPKDILEELDTVFGVSKPERPAPMQAYGHTDPASVRVTDAPLRPPLVRPSLMALRVTGETELPSQPPVQAHGITDPASVRVTQPKPKRQDTFDDRGMTADFVQPWNAVAKRYPTEASRIPGIRVNPNLQTAKLWAQIAPDGYLEVHPDLSRRKDVESILAHEIAHASGSDEKQATAFEQRDRPPSTPSQTLTKATSIGPAPSGPLGFVDFVKSLVTSEGGPPRLSKKGEALIPFAGPIAQAADYYDIIRAARRVRDGQGSSADERILLEFQTRDLEAQQRGTSFLYDVANVVANLPGFAMEFAATGGAFSGVRKVAKEGTEAAIAKLLKESVETVVQKRGVQAVSKTAGYVAGSAAHTAALPTRVAVEAARRQAPTPKEIEEKLLDWDDDFLPAFARATSDTFVEVFSERTGGALAKPVAKLAGTALGQRVTALKSAVLNQWLKLDPKNTLGEFMNRIAEGTAWNGIIGEIFEERVGEIMRAVQPYLREPNTEAPPMIRMVTGERSWELPANVDPRVAAAKDLAYQLAVEATAFAVPGAVRRLITAVPGRRDPPEQPPAGQVPPVEPPVAVRPGGSGLVAPGTPEPRRPPVVPSAAPVYPGHEFLPVGAESTTPGAQPDPEGARIRTDAEEAEYQRLKAERERMAATFQQTSAAAQENRRLEAARGADPLDAIDELLGVPKVEETPAVEAAKQDLKSIVRTKTPTDGNALLEANDLYERTRAGGDPAAVHGNEPVPWERAQAFDASWGGWKKSTETITPTPDLIASQGFISRPKVEEIKANFDALEGEKPQIVRTSDGTLILDGHHRMAAAMELGRPIEVQVYEQPAAAAPFKAGDTVRVKGLRNETFTVKRVDKDGWVWTSQSGKMRPDLLEAVEAPQPKGDNPPAKVDKPAELTPGQQVTYKGQPATVVSMDQGGRVRLRVGSDEDGVTRIVNPNLLMPLPQETAAAAAAQTPDPLDEIDRVLGVPPAPKADAIAEAPQLALKVEGAKAVRAVASLEEAARLVDQLRDEAEQAGEGGASRFPNTTVVDTRTGKTVATISYNGRIWPAEGWTPETKELVERHDGRGYGKTGTIIDVKPEKPVEEMSDEELAAQIAAELQAEDDAADTPAPPTTFKAGDYATWLQPISKPGATPVNRPHGAHVLEVKGSKAVIAIEDLNKATHVPISEAVVTRIVPVSELERLDTAPPFDPPKSVAARAKEEQLPAKKETASRVSVTPKKTPQVENKGTKFVLPSFATAGTEKVPRGDAAKQKLDAIAEERAAIEAENADLIKQLKAKLGRANMNAPLDPDAILLTVKLVRNYVKLGILDFQAAVIRFQEEWGDGARAMDRALELAWQKVRGGARPEVAHVLDGPSPEDVASRFAAAFEADPDAMVETYLERFENVVSADHAKELSPEYAKSTETRARYGNAVHPTSSQLAHAVYAELLSRPVVAGKEPTALFVVGGTGAGKTTALKTPALQALAAQAHQVFDGSFSEVENAAMRVQMALDAGKDVVLVYVHRDPVEAWQAVQSRGREEGRDIPLEYHARSHGRGLAIMDALAERFAGQPVAIRYYLNDAQGARAVEREALPEAYNEEDVRATLEDADQAQQGARGSVRGPRRESPSGRTEPEVPAEDEVGDADGTNRPVAGGESGESRPDRRGSGRGNRSRGETGAGSGAESGAQPRSGQGDGPRGTVPGPERDPALTPALYTITEADAIGTGSVKERITRNFAAIRVLRQLEAEKRGASPEEQRMLVRYVGWGGLSRIFEPWKNDPTEDERTESQQFWNEQHQALKDLLTDEEYRRARNSTQNAHYTSPTVIRAMWDAVKRLGIASGSALETSAGIGHFVGLAPADLRGALTWALVEKDPLTAQIAAALYPGAFTQAKALEKAQLPSEHFTLAISNVPFGKIPITDPTFTGPAFVRRRIHNYFFGKALDKVAPGGLVAFITTHGTLDARSNQQVREHLGGRADFLGAIRLPFTAFKKNAGTEVVTDIIFLRKRHEGAAPAHAAPWLDSRAVPLPNKKGEIVEQYVNEYMLDHPEMVLGKHTSTGKMRRVDAYNVEPTGDLAEQLAAAIRRLPEHAIDLMPPATSLTAFQQTLPPAGTRPFEYLIHEDRLAQIVDGAVTPVDVSAADEARIRGLLPIRAAIRDVYDLMAQDAPDAEVQAAQKALTKAYDAFVKKHGYISEDANWRAFHEDPDLPLLLSLEDYDSETERATKTAIFTTRTIRAERQARSADSPQQALQLVLGETGRIDLARAGELLGVSPEEAADQLERAGLIIDTPSGWQLPAQYLSGNVRVKLAEAEAAAAMDPRYATAVERLKAVIPEDIPAHKVNVRLGASWVPPEMVAEFIRELVGGPYDFKWRVTYSRFDAKWNIEGGPREHSSRYATPDVDTKTLLLAALNDRRLTIRTLATQTTPSRVDGDATALARQRREELHEAFVEWLFNAKPERREWAVRTYNDRFNAHVEPNVDGSYLTFHGMATYWRERIREHQRNSVARVLQFGNTLFAHVVGAGKTLAMTAAGMELRRMGLARKPLYVVPNHLISQWPSEFLQYYPSAKILIARPEDLEKENRRRFTARIASGDWDAVIMPYSAFVRVSMSPEAEMAYHREMLDEIETAIIEAWREEREQADSGTTRRGRARNSGRTPPNIKNLENMRDRLQAKLDKLANRPKDDMLSFEQLGVDALLVDEAHCFPYETPIITDRGLLPIGQIVEQRLRVRVLSFDTTTKRTVWKPVVQWYENHRSEPFVQIDYEGGSVVCTANHSVWTEEEGYVRADTVRPGLHRLLAADGEARQAPVSGREDLHRLPADVQVQAHWDQEHPKASDLLESVRGAVPSFTATPSSPLQGVAGEGPSDVARTAAREQGPSSFGAHAPEQSDGESGDTREDATVSRWSDVPGTRRERHVDATATTPSRAPESADRISDPDSGGEGPLRVAADLLQGGPRVSADETRDRDRRADAPSEEVALSGRAQDGGPRRARVVRVTVLERGRDGRPGPSGRDDSRVYCLGVADTHNFYADGALVSNSFKNLYFHTRQQAAGIPSDNDAQRATDLYLKVRHVNALTNYRNVVLATGTPVSNSMAEIFVMQKLLQEQTLKQAGIDSFDAWLAQFGLISIEMELDPSGTGMSARARLANYRNLGRLAELFRQVADVKMIDDLPELKNARPRLQGDAPEIIAVPSTDEQLAFLDVLKDRADHLDPKRRWLDNMAKITGDGRMSALDMRLIDRRRKDHPENKLHRVAQEVAAIYHQWKASKGTQLVFMDMGTPGSELRSQQDKEYYDPDSGTRQKRPPTVDERNRGMNLYGDLKKKLVKLGVPGAQIATIHEIDDVPPKKRDAARKALFRRVKEGQVRVLIGSSNKMGTGMNVQDRLVAEHNIDPTYKPSETEQRYGRILRQGNLFYIADPKTFRVRILNYVTTGVSNKFGFDAYMWQLNESKAKFIAKFFKGDVSDDTTGLDLDQTVLTASEMKAVATGNPAILELSKVQAEVDRLRMVRRGYEEQMREARWKRDSDESGRRHNEQDIERYDRTLAAVTPKPDRPTAAIDGKDIVGQNEIGEAIRAFAAQYTKETEASPAFFSKYERPVHVGSMRGLDLWLVGERDAGAPVVALRHPEDKPERYGGGSSDYYRPPTIDLLTPTADGVEWRDPENIGRALNGVVAAIERSRETAVYWREDYAKRIEALDKILTSEFSQQRELTAATAKMEDLQRQLGVGREQEREADTLADDEGAGGAPSGAASVGMFDEDAEPTTARLRFDGTIRPVEFPELVDLARELQTTPQVVKGFRGTWQKRGMFTVGGIRLHAELFKPENVRQLAATLAHEIGHLIDWLPDRVLKRGNILGRLRTLRDFLKGKYTGADGVTVSNKEIRAELLALSTMWRPWDESKASESFRAYRVSAKELYADAISVLLNNPGLLQQEAPIFFEEFFAELDAKPDVKRAYFDLQELLSGTREELIARRRGGVRGMYSHGDTKAIDLVRLQIQQRELERQDYHLRLKQQFLDKHAPFIERVEATEKKLGRRLNPDENPVNLLSERNYLGGKIKAWLDRYIQRIRTRLNDAAIDWLTFGEVLLYERIVAGDRSDIANPRGLSPDSAQELLDDLLTSLTEDQRTVLSDSVASFRTAVKRIATMAYRVGLLTDEQYETIRANPAYATFQVIEHLDDGVSSRIFKQIGTLKDVTNPADATILKTLVTIRAIEHQRVKVKAFQYLEQHHPGDIEQAQEVGSPKGKRPIDPKDKTQRLVTYFERGKLRGKYVDPYIADSLENASVGQNNAIVAVLNLLNSKFFRPIFTTYNPGFQTYNVVRDFLRFWKNIPGMSLVRAAKRYWQAVPLARIRAFGLKEKPTAAQLQAWEDLLQAEEAGILSITFNDQNRGREVEETQIEDILVRSGVGGFKAPDRHPVLRPLLKMLDMARGVGDFIETLPKAAGIYEFKGDGPISSIPADKRAFIREKVGSPDFLAGGTWKPVTNNVFLFSNAIAQAWRADFDVATRPETRVGFWWKTAAVNLVPKALTMAAILGFLGAGDDDEDDLARRLRRATEYDLTNYLVIPLGEDAHGNTIYLRLPQDDTGRFMGGLFWKALRLAAGDKDVLSSLAQVVDYTSGQFPSVTPTIEAVSHAVQFASGRNPYDAFRGRYLLTDDEQAARGWRATSKFLGWEFQQVGGSVVWKFYPGEDRPQERTTGQVILEMPVVSNVAGRFVRITNYGEVERLRETQKVVAGDEARQRLTERDAVNVKVRAYLQAPADEQYRGRQIQMAREIAAELYPDDPKLRAERREKLEKKVQLAVIRGHADPLADAVLGATSNNQKVAMIRKARGTMPADQFDRWLRTALQTGAISGNVFKEVRRDAVGAR